MGDKRDIEDKETRKRRPGLVQDETRRLHGSDRADPESVIDKVRCRVGKQDQSARQAQRPLDALR